MSESRIIYLFHGRYLLFFDNMQRSRHPARLKHTYKIIRFFLRKVSSDGGLPSFYLTLNNWKRYDLIIQYKSYCLADIIMCHAPPRECRFGGHGDIDLWTTTV